VRELEKPPDGKAIFLDEINPTFDCDGGSKNCFGGFTWLVIWGGGPRTEGTKA